MNNTLIGFSSSTPITKPELHNGGLWYYHSKDNYFVDVPVKKGTKKYRPHAFFYNLDVSTWLNF